MTRFILAAALLGLAGPALAQAPAADGVSFDQWSAKAREKLMQLDTNHDGKISKDEFAARADMMMAHARRGDTAPAGAAAAPDAAAPKHDGSRMFTRMDTNNDGYLDATEINALLARRFARQDANHDGMLTADERHAMRGMGASEQ